MNVRGFHFRLLFTAFLLIGGAVFIMGYVGLGMMQTYVQDRFEERNDFLSGYLARNSELGLLINDERMLSRLAHSLMSEPDVVGVEIFDSSGQELIRVMDDNPGQYVLSRADVRTRYMEDERIMSSDISGFHPASAIIGHVAVYLSLHEIQSMQKSLARTIVLLSSLVAFLSIICFYVISRSLVNPVNNLARIAGRIALGDRKVRAVPDSIPETRELACAFNSMLDSLERSNKQLERAYLDMARQKTMAELGRFAMLIAHEVKNPLSIIKSSLDVLKDEKGLNDGHPMVHYIEDEIRRISRLLEDFLSFSRPTQPVWESVNLNRLVEDCVRRFEVQVEAFQLKLIMDTDLKETIYRADPDLMAKAVHNLLKNAAEANEWSGTVFIRIRNHGSDWILEIEDQGPGIGYGMEEKIFEPFFTTKTKGSGLGLAFVSYVADLHGGSVRAYNNDEQGSLFCFTVPRSETSIGVE